MSSNPSIHTPLNPRNPHSYDGSFDSPPKIKRMPGGSIWEKIERDHIQQFKIYYENKLFGNKSDQFKFLLDVSDGDYIDAALFVIKGVFTLDAKEVIKIGQNKKGGFSFRFKYYDQCTCCFWTMQRRITKTVDLDINKGNRS